MGSGGFAFSKAGTIVAIVAVVYFAGGFDIIFNNPSILIFGIIAFVGYAVIK
jgi:hypothetical protein